MRNKKYIKEVKQEEEASVSYTLRLIASLGVIGIFLKFAGVAFMASISWWYLLAMMAIGLLWYLFWATLFTFIGVIIAAVAAFFVIMFEGIAGIFKKL